MIQEQIKRYTSRGRTISRSHVHQDMWIIDYGNGTFCAINTGTDCMLRMNPPDDVAQRLRVRPLNLN